MSIDWPSVKRVLVVRLRSIGDTVLATPSLIALRRFLPDAQIDILLEDWVAPVLDGFDAVDKVLIAGKSTTERLRTVRELRKRKYDVVFNLHGGTTSTFLTVASGARHRIGYREYRYSSRYTDLLSSSADFWGREKTHSAEQQLALLGFVGVPVDDRPKSRLVVTDAAHRSLEKKLTAETQSRREKKAETCPVGVPAAASPSGVQVGSVPLTNFALFHPTSAFKTKIWPTENFARTAEFLYEKGIQTIAVASKKEAEILNGLVTESGAPIIAFNDLPLQEITALASRAKLFVGNDSGIAHAAAAVNTPSVVIFGSSNRDHWYPWTAAPNEIVFEELPCQPCPGYECAVYGDPKCILSIQPEKVFAAIDRVLMQADAIWSA